MDAARQAEVLTIIAADPRVCVILNRGILLFWDDDEAGLPALPLASYIMNDMPMVTKSGAYEIRVNPRRTSPWISP